MFNVTRKFIGRIAFVAAFVMVAAVAASAVHVEQAKASYTYSHTDASVVCAASLDANGRILARMIKPYPPSMYGPAYDTAGSWQPILNRWNGSSWVVDLVGPQLYALDAAFNLPQWAGFTIRVTGYYYRVSIVYRHYNARTGQLAYTEPVAWAGSHVAANLLSTGQIVWGSQGGDYCFMK